MSRAQLSKSGSGNESEPRATVSAIMGMTAAFIATIVVAALIIRMASRETSTSAMNASANSVVVDTPAYGVQAALKSGRVEVQAAMQTLDFSIQPGESLDPKLPAGAFEGEFIVTFNPGEVRRARIGAIFQGGSIIIQREDELIASDATGDEVRMVLPITTVALARRTQRIRYTLRADGTHPVRLQAIWQPDGSSQPLVLISNVAAVH